MECKNPEKMLEAVLSCRAASARKLRLWGCGCIRHYAWNLLTDELSSRAVIRAEQFADGRISRAALRNTAQDADLGVIDYFFGSESGYETFLAGNAARTIACLGPDNVNPTVDAYRIAQNVSFLIGRAAGAIHDDVITTGEGLFLEEHLGPPISGETQERSSGDAIAGSDKEERLAAYETKMAGQIALVRCVFGNPFKSLPTIEAGWLSWNDATVPKLAQVLYDDRRFEDLPILADALEEAGCRDADILNHCRGPGPHVRGCWVVDLLLGKE
jgi:hypothetical protein